MTPNEEREITIRLRVSAEHVRETLYLLRAARQRSTRHRTADQLSQELRTTDEILSRVEARVVEALAVLAQADDSGPATVRRSA